MVVAQLHDPAVASRSTAGAEPHELVRKYAEMPPDHPSRQSARQQAIEAWLPLAERLARRFRDRGVPLEDVTQVASLGLIKAVDRYDAGFGSDFVSFATPTILGEIRRYFRDHTWDIRVPRRLKEMHLAAKQARDRLTHQFGRTPTVAELAADLNASPDEVVQSFLASPAYTALSLDAPVGEESGTELGHTLGGPDPDMALVELRMTLGPALAELPEREQHILAMRFYGNLTQAQIGERIGMSQMHVSRLLARSLAMLRDALADQP
jgi:RNA polymerase sigma-B factor